MSKENRRKKAYSECGDMTFEEWQKYNYDYFGESNADWVPKEENDRDEDDEPAELNFDH